MAPKYQQVADTLRPTFWTACTKADAPAHRTAPVPTVPGEPPDGASGPGCAGVRRTDRAPAGQRLSHPGPVQARPSAPAFCGRGHHLYQRLHLPQHPAGGGERSLRPQQRPPCSLPPRIRCPTSGRCSIPCWSCPPLDGVLVEGTKTGLPNPNLDLYGVSLTGGFPWSL